MDYLDFEIHVFEQDDDRIGVQVVHSPVGESSSLPFDFPLSRVELENQLLTLQNALLRAGNSRRRIVSGDLAKVQEFGQVLFDALMTDGIRSLYYESRNEAVHRGVGMRVKLRIEPASLAALPWEFMYDDRAGAFVCMSRNTPIVRYLSLPSPVRPLSVAPPLNVLAMVASLKDQETLYVQMVQARLRQALEKLEERSLVQLDWLPGDTWRDLQAALYRNQYHVFHFIGHGHFDTARDEGMIVFCDRNGDSRYFGATDLARLLADQTTLRLCLLNNCEGAKTGIQDPFSSTAAALVKRGVPAVVAMQYAITNEAAIQMAESFYSALTEGLPVDAAVAEARKGINFALNGSLEWGTPVLFMRASDGRIFDVEKGVASPLTAATRADTPTDTPTDDETMSGSMEAQDRDDMPIPDGRADVPPSTPVVRTTRQRAFGVGVMAALLLLAIIIGVSMSRFWPFGLATEADPAGQLIDAGPSETVEAAAAIATATPASIVMAVADSTPIAPSIADNSVPENIQAGAFTLVGRGEPGATIQIEVDGAPRGETTVSASGIWSHEVELAPGPHVIGVSATVDNQIVNSLDDPLIVNVPQTTPLTPEPDPGAEQAFAGMTFVYVPSGEFIMGSDNGSDDEMPAHTVYLDGFWIMKTEVTNADFAACVADDFCREPDSGAWDVPQFSDHPVTFVSLQDAEDYAAWLSEKSGRSFRLPTEAEWEKAARGTNARIYPWGNGWNGNRVNFCDRNCPEEHRDESVDDGYATTAPVGSYADSASPYGALDMAGNVLEWTADKYDAAYYAQSPDRNPTGPASGPLQVTRGGAWTQRQAAVRTIARGGDDPAGIYQDVGVRLVAP